MNFLEMIGLKKAPEATTPQPPVVTPEAPQTPPATPEAPVQPEPQPTTTPTPPTS